MTKSRVECESVVNALETSLTRLDAELARIGTPCGIDVINYRDRVAEERLRGEVAPGIVSGTEARGRCGQRPNNCAQPATRDDALFWA